VPRFLAKVVLALEPSIKKDKFHEEIRQITAHHHRNFMQMIGVDPVVFRSHSSRGDVDLQIWVTTVTGTMFNQLVLPFYFIGARKYIFMCDTEYSITFVSEVLDLTEDKINALYEFVILSPGNGSAKKYTQFKKRFEKLFSEKNLENYSFHQWKNSDDLINIFKDMVEDVVIAPYESYVVPVGFDLNTVEVIAKKRGFAINENHQILKTIDDITFRVDLKRNLVFAKITDCVTCSEVCKIERKLCIEIAEKGHATITGLGDIRMLSVLAAIDDQSILTLRGSKPQEDMQAQLKLLRKTYEKNCKKKKKK
jgi:hypothetical protein